MLVVAEDRGQRVLVRVMIGMRTIGHCAQWKESFSKHLWFAFVVVFLAEMGRIPCCGRAESSSSNI